MLGLICANGWVQYHEYAFLVRVSSGGISALKGKAHSEALKLMLYSIKTKQQLDLSKPNLVFELTMPFLRKHLDPFTYWRGRGASVSRDVFCFVTVDVFGKTVAVAEAKACQRVMLTSLL